METGVTVGGVHSIQYSIQISIQNSKSTVYHSMCMTPDQYITTNYFWARFSMKWYTNSFLLSSDYMLGDVYCTREQCCMHYDDVIMCAIASLITSLTIVYSTVYSDADQRKHQSYASLAFMWWIHRGPVNSPHKWPVTRKIFPFDDVIMYNLTLTEIEMSFWQNFHRWHWKLSFWQPPVEPVMKISSRWQQHFRFNVWTVRRKLYQYR